MSELDRARSLLYRRQILQENIRYKALDEIYKIYMLLHRECRMSNVVECRRWSENALNPVKSPFSAYLM